MAERNCSCCENWKPFQEMLHQMPWSSNGEVCSETDFGGGKYKCYLNLFNDFFLFCGLTRYVV